MCEITQEKLISLTSEFYSRVADSFSATRHNAWDGWERVFRSVDVPCDYSLLDVACGNLRFEKFLAEKGMIPEVAICVDNCESLLPEDVPEYVQFRKADLFFCELNYKVDLCVCFGFLHHIPNFERRRNFLAILMNNLKKGGYVALSFWQFMKDERIAKKAKKIDLELGDYLLGWKDRGDVFRYCHNFSDEEIKRLTEGYRIITEFSEDGKSHNLNKYVILKNNDL